MPRVVHFPASGCWVYNLTLMKDTCSRDGGLGIKCPPQRSRRYLNHFLDFVCLEVPNRVVNSLHRSLNPVKPADYFLISRKLAADLLRGNGDYCEGIIDVILQEHQDVFHQLAVNPLAIENLLDLVPSVVGFLLFLPNSLQLYQSRGGEPHEEKRIELHDIIEEGSLFSLMLEEID